MPKFLQKVLKINVVQKTITTTNKQNQPNKNSKKKKQTKTFLRFEKCRRQTLLIPKQEYSLEH